MERLTETGYENIPTDFADKNIWKCINKLRELEDAEEQGLLKMLPCPIGTMVHEPYRFCDDGAWEIDHHYLKLEDLDKIGKTVFVDENDAKAYIAEQEAESALAEKGGAE